MTEAAVFDATIARVWSELPDLLGAQMDAFESAALVRLRALESAPPELVFELQQALLALFREYPRAHERLMAELRLALESGERQAGGGQPELAGAVKYERYLDVPVFYATDRRPTGKRAPNMWFSGERGPLSYGVVRVGVPDDHRMGNLEKPHRWRLQFRPKPARDVMLLTIDTADSQTLADRGRNILHTAARPEALVFVHGYNVTFADAARRAAQIAYDLNFQGLTMLYSWPSEGATLRYTVDENNARWTLPDFHKFLHLALTEFGAQWVHAIAHSMGNRVLIDGLATFDTAALPDASAHLGQIVFAAPDLDAAVFRQLAPVFANRAHKYTLYASSQDLALLAAQGLARYPRAGQSGPDIVVVNGVDTIDATDLDTGLMGHSYVGDHTSILSDLFYLIRNGLPPSQRFGLSTAIHPDGTYWIFKPRRG